MWTIALLTLFLPAQNAPEDLEKRRDRLAARLEELRGLKFKAPLKVREGARREYAAFALENAKKVYGSDLGAAEKGLKALQLVPARVKLELALTLHAGFSVKVFARDGELIFIDRGVGDDLVLNKMALGLVDQHFSPKVGDTYDAQMAFAALRMGDAEVSKHLLWHSGKIPDEFRKKLAQETETWEKSDSKLASAVAPRLFIRTGDFSWRRGAVFAHAVFADGGKDALDRAYKRPPVSTEQVLHPEKYLRGEKPVEIDLAEADAYLAERGYKRVYRTVLGELGTALILETHFSKEELAGASEGWGGDTFAVYEKEGAPALVVWATEWDADRDAAEFHAEILKISLKVMPDEPHLFAIPVRKKSAVAFAVNVPKDLRDGLFEAVWKGKRSGGREGSYGD